MFAATIRPNKKALPSHSEGNDHVGELYYVKVG